MYQVLHLWYAQGFSAIQVKMKWSAPFSDNLNRCEGGRDLTYNRDIAKRGRRAGVERRNKKIRRTQRTEVLLPSWGISVIVPKTFNLQIFGKIIVEKMQHACFRVKGLQGEKRCAAGVHVIPNRPGWALHQMQPATEKNVNRVKTT